MEIFRDAHTAFLRGHLLKLPEAYASLDNNRMLALYFTVSGLKLLHKGSRSKIEFNNERKEVTKRSASTKTGQIISLPTSRKRKLATSSDDMFSSIEGAKTSNGDIHTDRDRVIDWIYAHQVIPAKRGATATIARTPTTTTAQNMETGGGFRGSLWCGNNFDPQGSSPSSKYDQSHIAATYSALAALYTLGDTFDRVNREATLHGLRRLQNKDGSFRGSEEGSENDLRFVYCAFAISHFLQDWSGVDVPGALEYIYQCQSYEGGFGVAPGLEAHGGPTYCATAALFLANKLSDLPRKADLIRWLLLRQEGHARGFSGRTNKDADSCQSFWVGASLQLLQVPLSFYSPKKVTEFLTDCQCKAVGGFCKFPGSSVPDLLHTYFSIVWIDKIRKQEEEEEDEDKKGSKDMANFNIDLALGVN